MKRFQTICLLHSFFVFMACQQKAVVPPSETGQQKVFCESGDTGLVRDVLYFGRNIPSGGKVSDADWAKFVDEVITSRFPDGLTIVDAQGQWKGENGEIAREQSKIVTLLHDGEEIHIKQILEIIQLYKERFQQEAVLRERMRSCAHF